MQALTGGTGVCSWWVKRSHVPLVGRDVLRGGCGLGTLGNLSVRWWCWVPTLLVVWPGAIQHWSLTAAVWGQVSAPKQQPLGKLALMITPWASTTSVLPPTASYSWLLPPQEDTAETFRQTLFQVPMESLLCPGSQCLWNLVCILQSGVSVFYPLVLWNSCSQAPLAFKSQMLWELLFPMPDPQAGEPDTALRTLSHVGEPLAGTGFDYIMKVPLLPSHCGFFVFRSRVSFLVGSSLSFWWLLIS